jgi:predicted nucleic acid-binding protein
LLAELPYRFIAPVEVMEELDAGVAAGHPAVECPGLTVMRLVSPVPPSIQSALGKGEAAVIQLALEQGWRHACLDDLRGRRLAKTMGLETLGVLGLLGQAKRRGIIPALAPYAERLVAAGARYHQDLVARMIKTIDG